MPEFSQTLSPEFLERRLAAVKDAIASGQAAPLAYGGGGPHNPGMEERVARLETHFEYVRKDLDEIKADNKAIRTTLGEIVAKLSTLPTRTGLFGYAATVAALSLAVIAAIIGGLEWIKVH